MKRVSGIAKLIELDNTVFHLDGDQALRVDDPVSIAGEKWLVTDFQEGMTRLMTVEGPVKYAELLARRKLQESGEFEEPVQIITHWKKKRGKNATDIFFTAVPVRLADFYFQVLRRQENVTLVVPQYALLWETLKRLRSKAPAAVVLRHGRFAEILIGDKGRIFFANRCVAFDTEPEQIQALWQTVLSDFANVENEHRIRISRIICLNWLQAEDQPSWPEDWLERVVCLPSVSIVADRATCRNSWPVTFKWLSLRLSASSLIDKLCYAARRLAPALNLVLAAAVMAVIGAFTLLGQQTQHLEYELAGVQQKIRTFRLTQPINVGTTDFTALIKFVQKINQQHRLPEYRKILADLDQGRFEGLTLETLKIEFAGDQVRLELFGDIRAPFDRAHSGYQILTHQLKKRGYKIVEKKFETQINSSKILLKLIGPAV